MGRRTKCRNGNWDAVVERGVTFFDTAEVPRERDPGGRSWSAPPFSYRDIGM
jgi:hypothetical protein